MPYVSPNDGSVVGVGQPIAVRFDENISDRLAAQRSISITTNPPIDGAFYWLNDREVRWRPAQYWKPGTTVSVQVKAYGADSAAAYLDRTTSRLASRSATRSLRLPTTPPRR
ncbi:Ig-like domain-containing protein [Mycolicibacterium aromaticivorans]|uniref:Ig-like domain-containing protein n=1 Tax=Mycolicibacterium aromaticivorans TaxID=318425 RepID=UPI00307B225E